MRHASVTFDPAASACDMPALLSIQRPRHATCRGVCGRPLPRGVCGRRRIWPGTCRGRVSGQLPCLGRGRQGRQPSLPGTRRPSCRQGRGVSNTPSKRHHRWRIHVPGVWSFIPCGMFGGAYAIRPYTGTCICPDGALRCWGLRPVELFMRLGVGACTRPNSPASADAPRG